MRIYKVVQPDGEGWCSASWYEDAEDLNWCTKASYQVGVETVAPNPDRPLFAFDNLEDALDFAGGLGFSKARVFEAFCPEYTKPRWRPAWIKGAMHLVHGTVFCQSIALLEQADGNSL